MTASDNLFKQAKQLLAKKDAGGELTKEERELINTAIIPLMILPQYNDTPMAIGLGELVGIVEDRGLGED